MIRNTFPEEPEIALAVFKGESGLNPETPSDCDITKDGYVYSWGLAQINLTQHTINGVDCYKAFNGHNNKATVIDHKMYQKCVKMATDPKISLQKARQIYEGRGNTFNAWSVYTSGAYLTKM